MLDRLSDSKPLVSVIIPTYNRLDYLKEAIESVLQQTYKNFEVVVSDDASPQTPESMLQTFQDDRIRLRCNATNLGVGWNTTYAFKATQGKYVAYLNDDDRWHPDFLETLVSPLEADENLAAAFCDYYVIDEHSVVNPHATEQQSRKESRHKLEEGIYRPFWREGLVYQAMFSASAAVIRREVIQWQEISNAGVFWDLYLTYLACRSGLGAYYSPKRLAYYRIHHQSENMMSGNRSALAKIRKGEAGSFCFKKFMEDPNLHRHKPYFRNEWAHFKATLGIGLLRNQQYVDSRMHLIQALQINFLNPRALVALGLSCLPTVLRNPLITIKNPGFNRLR